MRSLQGNKADLPEGLEPMEWAREVFALMDEGFSEQEAKDEVKRRHGDS